MSRTCRKINCPHPAMILSELCLSHGLERDQERLRATGTPPMFHEVYLTDEEQERYWEIENDYTGTEVEL